MRDILVMFGFSLIAILVIVLFREQVAAGVDLMGTYSGSPFAVAIAVGVFLVGSLVLVPQWMLIAAAIAAFGLVEGTAIAWFATMVSTTIHVFFARALETRLRNRLSSKRLDKLRNLFRRNSIQSGFIVRLIPTGPALLVNAAAGLFGVSRSGFLLGTSVGILPKIILTGIVASEVISTAQGQKLSGWLAVGALGLLAIFAVSRHLRRPIEAKEGK